MTISEKCAYIKGLAEGLDLDTTKPEGKLISAMLDLLSEITSEVEDSKERIDECSDYLEEIDEDLSYVEDIIYDEEDDDDDEDDENYDDECAGCTAESCDGCLVADDEDEEDDEKGFFCAMCPHCGEKIYFDESCKAEDLICPACQKPICDDEDDEDEADETETGKTED